MKIRALIIVAALSGGAAFAAAPYDTAKTPADADAKPAMDKSIAKDHKNVAKKHPAMHRAMKKQHAGMASSGPSTDVDNQSRQSRMDEALTKYRQHS